MKSKHVIVVEDDDETRLNIIAILEKYGNKVTATNNGLEGFKIINSFKNINTDVDLLISDINLPGITGIEMIRKLKSVQINIPTLVMTGYGNKDMLIELIRMGCQDYIDKPFTIGNFMNCVERVIKKKDEELRNKNIEEIKTKKSRDIINSKLKKYKTEYEELREQFNSAVKVYRELINNLQQGDFNVKVAFRYLPFKEIGGDFVDIRNNENGCDIIVADVSGHDLSSSYHTILIKSFFEKNSDKDGIDFFKSLNKELFKNGSNNRLVTASLIKMNFDTMIGEVVSAAHPAPIMLSSFHLNPCPLTSSGDMLGIHDAVSFDKKSFKFRKGDCIFLHTDGITNVFGSNKATGKMDKLRGAGLDDIIMKHCDRPLAEKIDAIWKDTLEYCDYKTSDDMMLLGVEIP